VVPVVDLSNPRAKIVRGYVHYHALLADVETFARVTPNPIISWSRTVVDEDGQTWNAIVCDEVLQPPLELGLVAGDSLHNFRTALDHLVCALVRSTGRDPKRSNQFPIQVDPPDADARKRMQRNLVRVPLVAQRRIEALQPFHDPSSERSSALDLLAFLDNTDKHQLVTPQVALSAWPRINVDPSDISPRGIVNFKQGAPLFPGATIFRWPLDSPIRDVTIEDLSAWVGFGGPERGITISGFPQIGQTVFDIVESFEGFRP
jgi:hypothetical protein